MASTAPAFGRFEIGGVVRRMVSGIGDNWRTLLIVAVITGVLAAAVSTLSMGQLASVLKPGDPTAALAMFTSPYYWTTVGGSSLVTTLSLTAMLGVLVGAESKAASVGDAFRIALRRFLPMLGLIILWALGLMVGYLLIVIPALILLTMWSASAPALVAEGIGPIAAFGRSRVLTKGFRWPVFGALVIFGIMYFALSIALQGGSTTGMLTLYGSSPVAALALATLVSTVMGILNAAFLAGLYGELRDAKEGGSNSQLADVFA